MRISVVSPVDGSIYAERETLSEEQLEVVLQKATKAQLPWNLSSLEKRASILERWVELLVSQSAEASLELTHQMGRPISQAPEELRQFQTRAMGGIEQAERHLEPRPMRRTGALESYRTRVPLGVILVQAGWNYPYIIAAHTVVPALLAGNSVVLKHSVQTPLCGERMEKAFLEAGGEPGVLQAVSLDQATTTKLTTHPAIKQVAVTGAVPKANDPRLLRKTRSVGVGLELGGKDSALVRADADLSVAARALAQATFYNAGQSCCGIEKIYIHGDVYQSFVKIFEDQVRELVVGDPISPKTTMGPMVRFQAAMAVHKQLSASIKQGATPLFAHVPPERAYINPQILVDVDHSMELMNEETFGPAVGLMEIRSDEQALELMNRSRYALASSVWTQDLVTGKELLHQLSAGSVFLNHCDHFEPAIAWLGLNDSGHGFTLSRMGFGMVTAHKTFLVKTPEVSDE